MRVIAVAAALVAASVLECRGRALEHHEAARATPADTSASPQAAVPGDARIASPAAVPPERITRPTAPWPPGRGPSCPGYAAVSPDGLLSCAACRDGTVHCWGDMSTRLVPPDQRRRPADVTVIAGITDAAAVSSGFNRACVLGPAGAVRCWGEQPLPTEVALPAKALVVDVGDLHACAVLATHEVACWGFNDWRQLGVDVSPGGKSWGLPPQMVPGLRADRIAVAANVSCAVDVTHRAWCWGWNGSGALGTGDRKSRPGRTRIGAFDDVVDVATDGSRACLQRTGGDVWCWGQPDRLERSTPPPRLVGRFPASRSLVVDGDTVGTLGLDGAVTTATGHAAPALRTDLPQARALSSRPGATCAILETGELRCWGDNQHGYLVLAVDGTDP